MAEFSTAHKFTAKWEGGFSDHPADRGGVTKYGVSINFLRGIAATQAGRDALDRMGVILPVSANTVRNLTREQAESLFRMAFWLPLRLDALPQRVGAVIYDMAVNHGAKRAVMLAQRGFNACAPRDEKLEEDGVMGPKTQAALAHDADDVLRAIVSARRDYYHAIVKHDASQSAHLRGWINRADDLARHLGVA